MKRLKADITYGGHLNNNTIQDTALALRILTRGDKINKRGVKGGAIFPQVITAVLSPLEKKARRSPLAGIYQI